MWEMEGSRELKRIAWGELGIKGVNRPLMKVKGGVEVKIDKRGLYDEGKNYGTYET
jgi:hypothetical protein